jgi:hypothetical protein
MALFRTRPALERKSVNYLKIVVSLISLCGVVSIAYADDHSLCEANAGQYLTGVVVKPPFFSHGQFKGGVELSHTHLSLKADQDHRVYDVAIDNVFASGYQPNRSVVPAPLNTIHTQDRLSLCGQLYTQGVGIHWVHTNCGQKPDANHPNGWIKKIASNGQTSPNFETNTQFCSLWPRRAYMHHGKWSW